jgi:hypothetical protein
MTYDTDRPQAPVWAYLACYLLVAVAFIPYSLALDRYPKPYVDESFFCFPAASYLDGTGFVYRVRDDAPKGDELWAYHAPFFPHLQIPVYAAFGVGQWSSRITEFLAANIAILILCRTLLGRGLKWSAISLAVAWLGDRSLQEVLDGRMEGLCLLCLACGFWALSGPPTLLRGALAGISLAAAFGFHPITFFYPIAGGFLALTLRGRAGAFWYTVGVAVPATAFFTFWLPDLKGSIKQFFWHARLFEQEDFTAKWASVLFVLLRWSKYWIIAVMGVTAVLTVRWVLHATDLARGTIPAHAITVLAVVFAACGLAGCVVITRGGFQPYNVVILTIWPVIAIATELESAPAKRTVLLPLSLAVILTACWLPSLVWNVARVREMVIHYREMDTSEFNAALRNELPDGARVTGDRELFGLVRAAGVQYRPCYWYAQEMTPDDEWLLVTDHEYASPRHLSDRDLRSRPLVRELNVYREGCPLQVRVLILGPRVPDGCSP